MFSIKDLIYFFIIIIIIIIIIITIIIYTHLLKPYPIKKKHGTTNKGDQSKQRKGRRVQEESKAAHTLKQKTSKKENTTVQPTKATEGSKRTGDARTPKTITTATT